MYRHEPQPPKRKWYKDILIILAIAASLWLLLFIRGVISGLITNETALAAVDVLTLLIAGGAAYVTFSSFGTRYAYVLDQNTLTLQATRGHRVVRQFSAPVNSITFEPNRSVTSVKKSNLYCYKGTEPVIFTHGQELFAFCPDQKLLEAIFNNK